jgi:predicted MFS family arabinose efflux permease
MTMSSIIITGKLLHALENPPANKPDIVSKREVAKWRAFINVSMTLGRSVGGPLGGVLTDTIGWRWYAFSLSFSCCQNL